MLAYPLALLMLLGFAASFALFFGSSTEPDDDDPPPEGEELIGSDGNDLLEGGPGNDLLRGGDGDDTLSGGPGDDSLYGEAGDDLLLGGEGDDLLDGGDGNDTLDGGGGINTLLGGEGDDVLVLHDNFEDRSRWIDGELVQERSYFDGGDGGEEEGDLLDASERTRGLVIREGEDGVIEARDAQRFHYVNISGFERYALGSGNDEIDLRNLTHEIWVDAGDGNDRIRLDNAANHTVLGGSGDDTISLAGFGTDTFVDGGDDGERNGDLLIVRQAQAGMAVTIGADGAGEATSGDNRLAFNGIESFEFYGDDITVDATRADPGIRVAAIGEGGTVLGTSGDDELRGGWNTTLMGGEGNDTLRGGGLLDGGDGDDLLIGSGTLLGGAGDDTLQGSGLLDGGEGDDLLQATLNDTTFAVMTGGAGMDTFHVSLDIDEADPRIWEPAQITDLEPGETISLDIRYANPSFAPEPEPVVTVEEDPDAGAVRILVDGRTAIVLQGLDALPTDALSVTVTPYDVYAEDP